MPQIKVVRNTWSKLYHIRKSYIYLSVFFCCLFPSLHKYEHCGDYTGKAKALCFRTLCTKRKTDGLYSIHSSQQYSCENILSNVMKIFYLIFIIICFRLRLYLSSILLCRFWHFLISSIYFLLLHAMCDKPSCFISNVDRCTTK